MCIYIIYIIYIPTIYISTPIRQLSITCSNNKIPLLLNNNNRNDNNILKYIIKHT